MKEFLDKACQDMTATWEDSRARVEVQINQFNAGVDTLIAIFGEDGLARKPGSKSFNRAIFDALIFYAADQTVREAMEAHSAAVTALYQECLADASFAEAIESDTAGIPHTFERLSRWGTGLKDKLNLEINIPDLVQQADGSMRIAFNGFR